MSSADQLRHDDIRTLLGMKAKSTGRNDMQEAHRILTSVARRWPTGPTAARQHSTINLAPPAMAALGRLTTALNKTEKALKASTTPAALKKQQGALVSLMASVINTVVGRTTNTTRMLPTAMRNNPTVKKATKDLNAAIVKTTSNIMGDITKVVTQVPKVLKPAMVRQARDGTKNVLDAAKKSGKQVTDIIVGFATNTVNTLKSHFKKLQDKTKASGGLLSGLLSGNGILSALSGRGGGAAASGGGGFFSTIMGVAGGVMLAKGVGGIFRLIGRGIAGSAKLLGRGAGALWTFAPPQVKLGIAVVAAVYGAYKLLTSDTMKQMAGKTKDFLVGKWKDIKTSFGGAIDTLTGWAGTIKDTIGGWVSGAVNIFSTAMSDITSKMPAMGTITDTVKDGFFSLVDGVKSAFWGIIESAKSAVLGIFSSWKPDFSKGGSNDSAPAYTPGSQGPFTRGGRRGGRSGAYQNQMSPSGVWQPPVTQGPARYVAPGAGRLPNIGPNPSKYPTLRRSDTLRGGGGSDLLMGGGPSSAPAQPSSTPLLDSLPGAIKDGTAAAAGYSSGMFKGGLEALNEKNARAAAEKLLEKSKTIVDGARKRYKGEKIDDKASTGEKLGGVGMAALQQLGTIVKDTAERTYNSSVGAVDTLNSAISSGDYSGVYGQLGRKAPGSFGWPSSAPSGGGGGGGGIAPGHGSTGTGGGEAAPSNPTGSLDPSKWYGEKGRVDRSAFEDQLKDPAVMEAFAGRMKSEVGGQGKAAQLAFAEEVFNRAAARHNGDLVAALSGNYYPTPHPGRSTSPDFFDSIQKAAKHGTDTIRGATGNASGTVGFGWPGGRSNPANQGTMIGRERFGLEYNDRNWKPTYQPLTDEDKNVVSAAEANKAAAQANQTGGAVGSDPITKDLIGSVHNFGEFKGGGPQGLVIHHTGGNEKNAEKVADVLRNRTDAARNGLATQYVIEKDGTIARLLPEGSRGAHVLPGRGGMSNRNMAGVEIIGRNEGEITKEQTDAAARLSAWHSKTYGYDPKANIVGHGEVNPGHREANPNSKYFEGKAFLDKWRGGEYDYLLTQQTEAQQAAAPASTSPSINNVLQQQEALRNSWAPRGDSTGGFHDLRPRNPLIGNYGQPGGTGPLIGNQPTAAGQAGLSQSSTASAPDAAAAHEAENPPPAPAPAPSPAAQQPAPAAPAPAAPAQSKTEIIEASRQSTDVEDTAMAMAVSTQTLA